MNKQHTPGPWAAERAGSGAAGYWTVYEGSWSGLIADVSIARMGAGREAEDEANARLISSAPDLLDALEDAIEDIEQRDERLPTWAYAARRAIAKARGQE